MVESDHRPMSVRRQCTLLGVHRSSFYYQGIPESQENLKLMKRIDQLYLEDPVYGYRRMTVMLRREGHQINHKRVSRLMGLMGLEAIYPRPRTSTPGKNHKVYPYLLRKRRAEGPNQVWSMDITYIPMKHGFMYLMAIIDWWSRYVISWQLANTMEAGLCVETLRKGIRKIGNKPHIFNTDQGTQFTSDRFTKVLKKREILISMDGRGRALDNVYIERLWRSLKYEDIYLREYADTMALEVGIRAWFQKYNRKRPHQSLKNATPWEYHYQSEEHGAQEASWWRGDGLVEENSEETNNGLRSQE